MILGATTVTRRRRAARTVDANGDAVIGADTDSSISMIVQPANGSDVRILPEGKRVAVTLKGYTTADVRGEDQDGGVPADEIVVLSGVHAGTYQVQHVGGHGAVMAHRKVLLARLDEAHP